MKEPEEVEHHVFVIRVMKRKSGNWYVSLSKDAIRVWTSELFLTKEAALKSILKHLPKS